MITYQLPRGLRAILCITMLVVCGCAEVASPSADATKPKAPGKLKTTDATKPKAPGKLKTTDVIGEFNVDDGKQVVDSKVKISNPITGALEAYQPLKEQVAGLGVDHALRLFDATEGRYPKDHDEFMTKVIKQNQIRLPQLGPGKSYEYDVQNHKLLIVLNKPEQP